ncbi:MAG: sulfite reductase, ferredoxin dependent, partial [Cyanobacteria bacterium P01_A01_bin.17]
CARPYMAEVGFVGIKPETYQLWLGGCPHQTRLARVYQELMPIQELEATLEPLLVYFKQSRSGKSESFGDFCDRISFESLRQFAQSYDPSAVSKARVRHRVNLRPEVYSRLKDKAQAEGQTLTELASNALEAYLQSQ